MSDERSRLLADSPEFQALMKNAPMGGIVSGGEGHDSPYVPTPEEFMEGVRQVLQANAALAEVQAQLVTEELREADRGKDA
jgi:hypothetical protein